MDWKRTMNRSKEEAPEFIQEYLNELLPELNLRLFLEMTEDETMLWAESITVTSYDDTVDAHQKKRRIFNHLMGMRTRVSSLFLKKYKKERR